MSDFICIKCGKEFDDIGSAHAHSHSHFNLLENLYMLINPFVNMFEKLDSNITKVEN